MNTPGSIQDQILALARQVGFTTAGLVPLPAPTEEVDRGRMLDFVEKGHAGEMEYLMRRNDEGELLRASVQIPFPWARSVIVCAANYYSGPPASLDNAGSEQGWIARYAWTGRKNQRGQMQPSDYHKVLLKRLKALEKELKSLWGDFESRGFVDTGPVVERTYARYAGLGWTGKNTCLLNQELGSWLFLAVLITSRQIPAEARLAPAANRCGTCRRCIEACPTDALAEPYRMDASRCIAYLTIEKRGSIPEELREGIGRQVFGCDICQDVCPWNRKAPISGDPELIPLQQLVNPSLDWLGQLGEEDFERVFAGSPVRRARHAGLRRNVAIAMGNSGNTSYLPQLQRWASQQENPTLQETASWAIEQIRRKKQNRSLE